MSAGRYSFTIEQGADFRRVFVWYDDEDGTVEHDVTGWSADLEVRDISGAVVVAMSTADGSINVGDASPGSIDCRLDADATEALTPSRLTHRYDLLLRSPDVPPLSVRLVEGVVTISPQVTDT